MNDGTMSFGRGSDLWTKIKQHERINGETRKEISRLSNETSRMNDMIDCHERVLASLKVQASAGIQIRL